MGGEFSPLTATGMAARHEGREHFFLGTCFAFRESSSFLTAAHVVGDVANEALRVWLMGREGVFMPVTEVEHHPTADLALLRVSPEAARGVEPFWRSLPATFGEPFVAFGYPENVFGDDATQPTARLFRGHYQRFFAHRSHLGYRYEAGELSIPRHAA